MMPPIALAVLAHSAVLTPLIGIALVVLAVRLLGRQR
jgi:hypothetical protein